MTMPAALAEVVSDFADVTGQDKLALLLEFANELPPLPADLEEAAQAHRMLESRKSVGATVLIP